MLKKIFLLCLVVLISCFCGYVYHDSRVESFVKSKLNYSTDELGMYYYKMLTVHKRIDLQVPDKSVILIGDSISQGLLYPQLINYGIGSDTTLGVINRLDKYKSLKNASKIILMIGVNDLSRRDNADILKNYNRILDALPAEKLVVFAILPISQSVEDKKRKISNLRIQQINQSLEKICADRKVRFINMNERYLNSMGGLDDRYHVGDGVHLNRQGYEIWKEYLRDI